MSTLATLPLPLELTSPVQQTSNAETQLKAILDVENTRYNPVTQVRENQAGEPQIHNGLTITVIVSTILGHDKDNAYDD